MRVTPGRAAIEQRMTLVTPTQSNAGDEITAATINGPVNALAAVINGNIDDTNIASVSGSKLAAGSIPAGKYGAASVSNAALATGAGEPGGAWTSYTPTLTNIAIGTGGSPSASVKYTQVGKTIKGKLYIQLGTTSSSVSGEITFSLPVASAAIVGSPAVSPIGIARMFDGVGTVAAGYVIYVSTTAAAVRPLRADTTYVTQVISSSTVPFTWNAADEISATFEYEAA